MDTIKIKNGIPSLIVNKLLRKVLKKYIGNLASDISIHGINICEDVSGTNLNIDGSFSISVNKNDLYKELEKIL